MTSKPPPWDANLPPLGPPDHIHAVGAFALCYNDLELTLYALFLHFVPLATGPNEYLFFTLNNNERGNLLRTIAEAHHDGVEAHAVRHAATCFQICAENRNLLLHGIPSGHDGISITVSKRMSEKSGLKSFTFMLDQIRGAAISSARTADYIIDLAKCLEARAKHNPLRVGGKPPLPDRPPLPDKLNPPPPPPGKSGGPPPPEPSKG